MPIREHVLHTLGLQPMAHRPPLVRRYWFYCASAYLMPVLLQVAFPEDTSSMDELIWLVTLVPAFILSLHYGLRGALAALVLGTTLLLTVQITLALHYTPDDPRVIVPIYLAYGLLAISVGWLSEELHRHYELVLELRAKQKSDALGNLAAGIAHDFNNILTAIVANAELVAGSAASRSPEVREEMTLLEAAAARGAGMVRNLLGLSRRGMLALGPVDMGRVVHDRAAKLRHLIPDTVEIDLSHAEALPPVMADADAVEQILANLLTNARDAMPQGGRLRIEVGPRRLNAEQRRRRGWGDPGAYVCVCVSDTGAGMDEEALRRVFEPFYTTKEPGEGIGLGMALVYGLVKQHRGFVDVTSVEGEGTTAEVYFPVTRDRVVQPPATRPDVPRERRETILVIEDEQAIRSAAERILSRCGYTVATAADGDEGIAVYRRLQDEIALVVCDVLLPGLTGPEVYEEIRSHPAPPRFLFMSGYPSGNLRDGVALDADLPFLPKPWSVEEFTRSVREVLDGS